MEQIKKKVLDSTFYKKNRKTFGRWFRALIQLLYFLFLPSAFTAAFSGVKYIFTQIGAGTQLHWTSFISVLVVLCVYTIVFGRFFCGFACAFGALGDAVHGGFLWICKKIHKKPPCVLAKGRMMHWLSFVKFLILALIVLLCFGGLYGKASGTSPWDVFSMVHAGNFRLGNYGVGIVLLILILVGMALQERFFCRVLCPMGAVFALLPVLPFFALHRDRQSCVKGCSACMRTCPADVELPDCGSLTVSGECFQCQKCIGICPKKHIGCGIPAIKGNEFWLTLLRALLLAVLLYVAGI